jgi:hypothetical protein
MRTGGCCSEWTRTRRSQERARIRAPTAWSPPCPCSYLVERLPLGLGSAPVAPLPGGSCLSSAMRLLLGSVSSHCSASASRAPHLCRVQAEHSTWPCTCYSAPMGRDALWPLVAVAPPAVARGTAPATTGPRPTRPQAFGLSPKHVWPPQTVWCPSRPPSAL